jgi:hypothetical protein
VKSPREGLSGECRVISKGQSNEIESVAHLGSDCGCMSGPVFAQNACLQCVKEKLEGAKEKAVANAALGALGGPSLGILLAQFAAQSWVQPRTIKIKGNVMT